MSPGFAILVSVIVFLSTPLPALIATAASVAFA